MKKLFKKAKQLFKDKYFRLDLLTYITALIIFIDTLTISVRAGFYVLAVELGLKVFINYYIYSNK